MQAGAALGEGVPAGAQRKMRVEGEKGTRTCWLVKAFCMDSRWGGPKGDR